MYAQSNYPNVALGIPPTRYTIAQAGCFITSFCNLLARHGRGVDPPTINAFLRDHGLYLADPSDGVREDVAWDTITKYDPGATVASLGGASRPPTNDSIVKFIYNGGASTHFCLVNDINAGTIVDSWDAKIKSWDVYGGVKAWASYNVKGGDNMTRGTMAALKFLATRQNEVTDSEFSKYQNDPEGFAQYLTTVQSEHNLSPQSYPPLSAGAMNIFKQVATRQSISDDEFKKYNADIPGFAAYLLDVQKEHGITPQSDSAASDAAKKLVQIKQIVES